MAIILAGMPQIFSTSLGWTHPRPSARLKGPVRQGSFAQRRHPNGMFRGCTWLHCHTLFPPAPTRSIAAFPFGWTASSRSWKTSALLPTRTPCTIYRVAIRRCRSVAAVMEEADPDPAWPAMRKWRANFSAPRCTSRHASVWTSGSRSSLPKRPRPHTPANCVRIERTEAARERAAVAKIRSKNPGSAWSALCTNAPALFLSEALPQNARTRTIRKRKGASRQGPAHRKTQTLSRAAHWMKRFPLRGIESLLPSTIAAWATISAPPGHARRDSRFDVLAEVVKKSDFHETEDSLKLGRKSSSASRRERIETYVRLTLGKTSLWNIWRSGLPTNGRVEAAALARCALPPAPLIPMCAALLKFPASPSHFSTPSSARTPLPRFSDASLHRLCLLRLACMRRQRGGRKSPKKPPQVPSVSPFLPDGATKIGNSSLLRSVTIAG